MLPTPAHAKPFFQTIDLLRGFAALMVIVFHVIALGHWTQFPTSGPLKLFRNGWVGVDLFFVISGFVITLAAANGYASHGTEFRRQFALRRFARIAPLYFLSGAVYLFCVKPEMLGAPFPQLAARVLGYALFVQNLHPFLHGAINGPSWSVALEMQFYVVMILATPWLVRVRTIPVVISVILLAALYRFATTVILPPGSAPISERFVFLTQLPGVAGQFAVGMALGLAVHRGKGRLSRLLRPSWICFAMWALIAAFLLSVAAKAFDATQYWAEPWMLVAWRPLLTAGFCALLAGAITFPAANATWMAPLRYAGTISYGLYLWHFPILVALTTHQPHLTGIGLLVRVLAGTVLLAVLSWHLMEQPFVRRFGVRQAVGAPASAV
jgi:peptidoglycan/LPS O-acetylase OafA/YrhL